MTDHNNFSSSETGTTGWLVGQSIATELDVALTAMTGGFPLGGVPPELSELVTSAPADWLAEGAGLLGEVKGFVSILSHLASLAGVLQEGDYSRATLAMRELATGPALERLAERAAPFGLEPVDGLYRSLYREYPNVYPLGDCGGGKKIHDAIWSAYGLVREL